MTNPPTPQQADREAARSFLLTHWPKFDGLAPCSALMQAFAHHAQQARLEERERAASIAEHLNGWGSPPAPELAAHIAAVIRKGEAPGFIKHAEGK